MQQAHRFIEVGFAAAIGAGDNVELTEFQLQGANGPVVSERELFDHGTGLKNRGAL
ncbi:hypothetical protein ACZ87_01716 [Candidatus Erwinia dacicola]|uniref:Uncharacterized protein n=1 Tax=Candidatus Erwinia dacicola TaxID=252393 RepID=A0A328TQ07_9GAMM|nr:hypothetical protein ACZ87_01716 [Candidatus Erwinia dacicola]